MSVIADPLALYGRPIDKGVERTLARALSDALHEAPSGLATEASVSELREEMRQGFASIRDEGAKTNARIDKLDTRTDGLEARIDARFDAIDARFTVVNGRIDALPNALLLRLGSLMVVLAGVIVTSLRLWPVH